MAIITISRGTFSGGQSLAECVAETLGYRCIAARVLVEAASEYGMPLDELSKALEEPPGFLERLTTERAHYLACIRAILSKEVKNENVVYHGHAGHLLLAGFPHLLRVRVVTDMESRIKAAMERRKLNRDEAKELIKKVDEKRIRWTKFLYHADWTSPSLYDIVINLTQLNIPSACDIITHSASLDEFNITPESQKLMEDLLLSTEVRAIIASNAPSLGYGDAGIEVKAHEGTVTIGGTVRSLEDADKIRDLVRKSPGVIEIDSKMQITHYM